MLWAATLWEEVFFPEHEPHFAYHDGQACVEGLAEGANFHRRCCVWAWKLVHDIPRDGHEVKRSNFAVKAVLLLGLLLPSSMGAIGAGGGMGGCVWSIVL